MNHGRSLSDVIVSAIAIVIVATIAGKQQSRTDMEVIATPETKCITENARTDQ